MLDLLKKIFHFQVCRAVPSLKQEHTTHRVSTSTLSLFRTPPRINTISTPITQRHFTGNTPPDTTPLFNTTNEPSSIIPTHDSPNPPIPPVHVQREIITRAKIRNS